MGVKGPGNFDNDEALYHLDMLIQQLVRTIENIFSHQFNLSDGEALIISNVDILVTLCQAYRETPFVEESVVRQWKEIYLLRYDEQIDDYGPDLEYKVQRRQVIEETFNKLEILARDHPY
jgi:hypothetical protein